MKPKTSLRMKAAKSSPRRQEQKLRRQEAILAAAFEEFAARGYAAARIDDVARRAGIAKGTIYLYFPTKERLFRAVVRNLPQKGFGAVPEHFDASGEQLVCELLSRMYNGLVRNSKIDSIARLLIAEGIRFPKLVEIYHREIIAPGMKAMRQVLLHGISRGEFRKTAAVEFPQLVAAPAILAIMWRVLHGKRHRLSLEAYSKAHLELLMAGLRKPAG